MMQSQYIPDNITLNNNTLAQLPIEVKRPMYNRCELKPGIVHIGVGNFHRAHQAWFLHRLMQRGLAQDWAIVGAGVRPFDEAQRQKLSAQDYLYSLVELSTGSETAEVVGSLIDYLPIEPDNASLIKTMADPSIRIVSLTVTEGGYYIDPASNAFDGSHPDIVHDAANPQSPRTAFGAMLAALRLRREQGLPPFTCMSCDNLQGNGVILKQTLLSLAKISDPELASWLEREGSFPNSMVDCIVPATGPRELELVKRFGLDDAVPVTHEPFRQWVIEDDFCAGRPDWDLVGAQFTDDVHDFETMKIRLLNGGHQLLANAGELLGVESIDGCIRHALIRGFFECVEHREIAPHVRPVPGMTPTDYIALITERFANPEIRDTTRRVAFDGSSRHAGFLLPTLREAITSGGAVQGLLLAEALWARMCAGTREDGSEIVANDPNWDQLLGVAIQAKSNPRAWLEQREIYGDLADNPAVLETFDRWLNKLWQEGTEATLQGWIGDD
ncbi:MAG: mannitol dehydrogenase family protein [Granulosicoccaceae bacterium]